MAEVLVQIAYQAVRHIALQIRVIHEKFTEAELSIVKLKDHTLPGEHCVPQVHRPPGGVRPAHPPGYV